MKKNFLIMLCIFTALSCILFVSCELLNDKTNYIQYVINLNADTHEISYTDTLQIKATVMPKNYNDGDILWSSSDNSIATVDSTGLVTGKSGGNVKITARIGDCSKALSLLITQPKIAVIENALEIPLGESRTLHYTENEANIIPVLMHSSGTPILVSENHTSNGVILTGISAGTNEYWYQMTVDGVVYNSNHFTITVSGTSAPTEVTFIANKVSSINAVSFPVARLTYKSSDTSIVTIDEQGNMTGISPGTATIYILNTRTGEEITSKVIIKAPIVISFDSATDLELFTFSGSVSDEWTLDTDNYYSGNSSLKSLYIYHSEVTSASITIPTVFTSVSFYAKVSSESGYDMLSFSINNVPQPMNGNVKGISGEEDWALYTYPLSPSQENTLTWTYSKDQSDSDYDDCGWIDSIIVE